MGALGVWIAQHAKLIVAWSARLVAWGVLVAVFVSQGVYSRIGAMITNCVGVFARVATAAPTAFTTLNTNINAMSQESDAVSLLLWLFNFSVLDDLLALVVGDLTIIITALISCIGVSLVIISAIWTYKIVQRLTNVAAEGKLGGSDFTN